MLGTDFPYRPFYPENAKVIQVDRDPSALGRRVPLTQGIIGTVKDTLKELLPLVGQRGVLNLLILYVKHIQNLELT